MKEKKYKYVEDVIEDYLRLTDEQIEIPLLISKAHQKYDALMQEQNGGVLKKGDLDDVFKIFTQTKKLEDRKAEITEEIADVENYLKQFLKFVKDKQIAYEKRDDIEKAKLTYLFWLEGDEIKSNRVSHNQKPE